MTDQNRHLQNGEIDEALWAAYRRDDKAAVTGYLFRRSMVGMGRSRSLPELVIKSSSRKGRGARRARGGVMLINGGVRQISTHSRLN